MKNQLKLKSPQKGFAHILLLAMIAVVVGTATYGTFQVINSFADAKNTSISVNTANGCWLAGRKWDDGGKKQGICLAACRNQATKFLKNGSASGYCAGHVWIMDDVERCNTQLHRIYITEVKGCDRKPSQTDGADARYCQEGYGYYNADYTNRAEEKSGRVDVCEVSKRAAIRNEKNGTPGKSNPTQTSGSSTTTSPSNGGASGGSSAGSSAGAGSSSHTVKKATIKIGSYNAWSVTKTNSSDQARRLAIGMAKMRDNGAEIVALQEFSPSQTFYLKNNAYWGVYRSNMAGSRGLGIAYKKDAYRVISSGDYSIPRSGANQREPVMTLQRKSDNAKITVMSVHLVAFTYGKKNYESYQPKQQAIVKDKALSLHKQGNVVIVAGDFNWDFSKRKGYMDTLVHQGVRYTNFFAPNDEKISNFKDIDAGQASDHRLIFVDVEPGSAN